jgi:hypothetical protein
MSEIEQLVNQLAEATDSHQRDTKVLETLATIARLGVSTEDIGHVLFNDVNNGDWDETARYVEALIARTAGILQCWYAAARLDYLNQNREQ